MWITLKNDMFGLFQNRGERDNDNEISLKEGGGIEMSIYSAFHIRDVRSLRFELLTIDCDRWVDNSLSFQMLLMLETRKVYENFL